MKNQRGAALVEFAFIALVFFMLLFGIVEFGRVWFTYNTLAEATRRGARVAAVCPADGTGMKQVQQTAFFDETHTQNSGMFGLSTANVAVSYLTSDMTAVATPLAANSATYDSIAFVRVQIQNFTHTLLIPVFSRTFAIPPIATTLPSESLGRTSSQNPVTQRCCFGVCS